MGCRSTCASRSDCRSRTIGCCAALPQRAASQCSASAREPRAADSATRAARRAACSGELQRAGRQVDLASRADARRHRRGQHRDQRLSRERGLPGDAGGAARARACASSGRSRDRGARARRRAATDCRALPRPLDMGNAGTAMRLFMGLLAGQRFDSTLIGDASLMRRPMERVAAPLRAMGARIDTARGQAAGAASTAARRCAASTTRCRWRARR